MIDRGLNPSRSGAAFARYLLSGAVGTVAHYCVLVGLVEGGHITPPVATTCGFATGAGVNYLLNYQFTFRSTRRHREALPRFVSLAFVGAVANAAIVAAGIKWLRLPYLIPQVAATGVVVIGTFLGNRFWTFRRMPHE